MKFLPNLKPNSKENIDEIIKEGGAVIEMERKDARSVIDVLTKQGYYFSRKGEKENEPWRRKVQELGRQADLYSPEGICVAEFLDGKVYFDARMKDLLTVISQGYRVPENNSQDS